MRRKGFTLVELLAVIAILAILVIIALPNVLKMYNTSKKNIFLVEAKEIYGEVSKKYMTESMKGNTISYISSEDNTKLNMTGESLKYCIKVGNGGKITSMKIGNNNYYLYYDGSTDISKIDISQVYEGKYNQKECNASTVITKDGETPSSPEKACTYDGKIEKGTLITIGKYTYHYKQDISSAGKEIEIDGFRVELADKESTEPVTEAPCTTINGKPVVSMAMMFMNSKASSIDFSNFNTSKVTNMASMFLSAKPNKIINFNKIDASNITNMYGMFSGIQVDELILDNMNFSKVTDMSGMFVGCIIDSLSLKNINASSVTNMAQLFYGSAVNNLSIQNFDASNVANMRAMFVGSNIPTIDFSSFKVSKAEDMGSMFNGAYGTTKIIFGKDFDTSNVTDMSMMFYGLNVKKLDLSFFDTSKLTNVFMMFNNCGAEKIFFGDKFTVKNVTDMSHMFERSKATELDLSTFDLTNVTNMVSMLEECSATVGYARTQADADKLNASSSRTFKPSTLTFSVK